VKRKPFRIGTTSYIYPADIITNVRRLAGIVDDVEIVLFEVARDDDLPTHELLSEMKDIAAEKNMSYTIHLPIHAALGDPDETLRIASSESAMKVVALAGRLDPWAYVIHLNPFESGDPRPDTEWRDWAHRCAKSLSLIASRSADAERLCIENLEGYEISRLAPVLDELPVSLCLDIGHLWVQHIDPVQCIERYAKRIRVVHIHGIDIRDHASLENTDARELNRVLDALAVNGFGGVLTIEVFRYRDLASSLRCIGKWAKQRRGELV
jgi:sugar phosphate isomerase/epimerase